MSVTVLGAGIGGLSAAHYIKKLSLKPITILEATDRVGGWINSHKFDDGLIFEAGPRTIRPKGLPGANTLEIVEELGLEKFLKPIDSQHIAAKNRMIYAKGQLCLLPSSLPSIFTKRPPFEESLFNVITKGLKARRFEKKDDESIYDFVERQFGTEVADYLISPMICGICAGNAKEISVNFLMSNIFAHEQKHGDLIKGFFMSKLAKKDKFPTVMSLRLANRAKKERWNIYSFDGGLEIFPRKLAVLLQQRNVKIQLHSPCDKIEFLSNNVVNLHCGDEIRDTEYVVSSLPSFKLAETVQDQHPTLANHLKSIPFVDVAVINFQYNDPELIKQPGFGVLVPPKEKLPILGIIFDSCCFDMEDQTVLTVMMGGHWFRELFGNDPDPENLKKIALENIEKILGINAEPNKAQVNIHRKCIPQYTLGHLARVKAIRQYIAEKKLPLGVCGASYDGVGVNDVILSARHAAKPFYL
ncbi:protoporphyrinogen oxidase [Culicoides brevitarsis]|uniref:protoporphyrinogen oxidase n=1 Tax=Culicoides brevitarsis TaxID=469753 RepID=UPI00307B4864